MVPVPSKRKKPEKEKEQEEKPERGLTEQSMGQRTEKLSLIHSKEFNFTIFVGVVHRKP